MSGFIYELSGSVKSSWYGSERAHPTKSRDH